MSSLEVANGTADVPVSKADASGLPTTRLPRYRTGLLSAALGFPRATHAGKSALLGRSRVETKPNRRNGGRTNFDDRLLETHSPERKEFPTCSKVSLDR